MRHTLVILVTIVMLPLTAWAQPQPIRDALVASRALYPTPMKPAQTCEMLSRAIVNHPGWALLRKDGGNNCPTPYPGIGVSSDWIIDVVSGWGYDVLRDQEGVGALVWSDGVPNGAGITTVPAWPVGAPQQPQDPQQPGEPIYGAREQMLEDRVVVRVGNLTAAIIATMNQMFGCRDDGKDQWGEPCATVQDNARAIRGTSTKVDGVSQQVQAHDEKTNALIGFLKKPETLTAIITAITTIFVTKKGI